MRQHELAPPPGANRKRKRLGRGWGSGHGGTSGRGTKGQKSRSGSGPRPGFEGGQLPLIQRMPSKRGFTNIFRREYSVVNLSRLDAFEEGTEVDPQRLHQAGVIKSMRKPVKILGQGEITKPLTVKANKFSKSAKQKIEAVGGKTEELAHAPSTSSRS